MTSNTPTSTFWNASPPAEAAEPLLEEHHQHIKDTPNGTSDFPGQSFTLRAVIVGLVIGIPVCVSNVYFGLQTGFYDSMAIATSAIGFAVIKFIRTSRSIPFSAKENVLIQTVAGATGCMPAAAGLLAAIPALEFLTGHDDNGPIKLTYVKTVLWAMGVGFFGLIFTMFLRGRLVTRTNLPYPGPLATASLLKTLHLKKIADSPPEYVACESLDPEVVISVPTSTDDNVGVGSDKRYSAQVSAMGWAALGSGLLHLPIMGVNAREDWLWYLDLSPGFIGMGIITGPVIPYHMMCGAIVGWGILSPIAHTKGWVEGDVGDWESGARGWISWIGLAALFADCAVKLTLPFVVAVTEYLHRNRPRSGYTLVAGTVDNEIGSLRESQSPPYAGSEPMAGSHSTNSSRALMLGLLLASILCVAATSVAFRFMSTYIILVAIAVALPLSVMGIQAVGETDFNPAAGIGKVSQLLFAVIVPRSNPNAILINLVAGSIAEAGATQAGDIVGDLRLGYLLGADPRAQLYGQLIGCFVGAFVSCGFYKLFTSAHVVPGSLFQVPMAFLSFMSARLVTGNGLPIHVPEVGLGFGIFFLLAAIVKIRYASKTWHRFIPSGTAFAVGIITSPSFSIARLIGGIIYWYSTSYGARSKEFMILLASGLVFGEGLFSLVTLVLKIFAGH